MTMLFLICKLLFVSLGGTLMCGLSNIKLPKMRILFSRFILASLPLYVPPAFAHSPNAWSIQSSEQMDV